MRDLIAETQATIISLEERKARNQERDVPFVPVGKAKKKGKPANARAATARPGTKGGREAAEIGDKRQWARGEVVKTKKGWVDVPKGKGKKAAPDKKGSEKAGAETAGKKDDLPPTKPGSPRVSEKLPEKDWPKAGKSGLPSKKGKIGIKASEWFKKHPSHPPDEDEKKKKKGKKGAAKDTTAEEPEDPLDDKEPEEGRDEKHKAIHKRLKSGHKDIFPTFKKMWKGFKELVTDEGTKEKLTTNFSAKLAAEGKQTKEMLSTVARSMIPGHHPKKKEVHAARKQFCDLAKGVLLTSLVASPLGLIGVGLVASGIRIDKVLDKLIDRPLRHMTKKVFGQEHGLLPDSFYKDFSETDEKGEKGKSKPEAGGKKPAEKPKAKKPKVEWKHAEDGKLGEEPEGEDIDVDAIQDGAQEQAQEKLAEVFQALLDELAQMDPHEEDFSAALLDAGVKPDQIDGLTKYAKMAQGTTKKVEEAVAELHKLSYLPESAAP